MPSVRVKDEISHVLDKRNMYLGDASNITEKTFTFDIRSMKLEYKEISYNAALLKIFDEILVNAIDNLSRNSSKPLTTIELNFKKNEEFKTFEISIKNDGPSIPIEQYHIHERDVDEAEDDYKARMEIEKLQEGKYIPEVVFSTFRSSSNYDKAEDSTRITGGTNGIGAKLTAVFSKLFKVRIENSGKLYEQEIRNHCRDVQPPKITETSNDNSSVQITFVPDWELLDTERIYHDIDWNAIEVMSKRLYDFTHLGLKLTINGKLLPSLTFKDFSSTHVHLIDDTVQLYESPMPHEFNKWKVAFGYGQGKNTMVSYVNNVATYSHGGHVDGIRRQIAEAIIKSCKKEIKTVSIYPKLSLVVYAIVPGAQFTSQAKTALSKKKIEVPQLSSGIIDKFIKESGVVEYFNTGRVKSSNKTTKRERITNIAKLIDAEDAGKPLVKRQDRAECSLFICEGDSAQSLCINMIKKLGEKHYGTFALRGKVLNTQKVSSSRYLENNELTNLKTIIGLVDGKEYSSAESLRYQHVICCKDADSDGSAIMGLVINFFYQYFKSLILIPGFFKEFITPVCNLYSLPYSSKSSTPAMMFYNMNVYNEKIKELDMKKYKPKFIKGLGGNSDPDINLYSEHFDEHINSIDCGTPGTENHIKLAYSNGKSDAGEKLTDLRKEWISHVTFESYLPREVGVPVKFDEFCDIDLALAANETCERSIPSVLDGLKPSQRKVLYTLFNMSEKDMYTPTKVFQLTGSVTKFAKYHHGDASMNDTIIRMGQDFVGANNIPILDREGQFGTRNQLGNDAPAPRYIGACLSKITRLIFPKIDDKLLELRLEDNEPVEPISYVPIIPMLLVNGAIGIGTGWNTRIPQFNPKQLIGIVAKMLRGIPKVKCTEHLMPYYEGFRGSIYEDEKQWIFDGNVKCLDMKTIKVNPDSADSYEIQAGRTFIIDEIPIGRSIEQFRERLNKLVGDKKIVDYSNLVNSKSKKDFEFKVKFSQDMTIADVYCDLNLRETFSKNILVAYDSGNHIKRYLTVNNIIEEWFITRYKLYQLRKKHILSIYERELLILKNKYRFASSKYDLTKMSKKELLELLEKEKYDQDEGSWDYLRKMPIDSSSKFKLDKFQAKIEAKQAEIDELKRTSIAVMWARELANLNAKLNG